MGKIKVDLTKAQRSYADKYRCLDAKGIALLLRDGHRIRSRTYYAGDYAGIDILTDLDRAMETASLTARQAESLNWVYVHDVTLDTAGHLMGITKQAVKHAVTTATEKIAKVFQQWNYSDARFEGPEEGEAIGTQ